MKKVLSVLILFLLAFSAVSVQAQNQKQDNKKSHSQMRKELQEYKLKFLTDELGLQGGAKSQFAEAFNENFETQSKLFREKRQAKKTLQGKENPTENDYAEFQKVEKNVKAREQEADKQYRAKLDKILTPSQIFKLQQAEDKFRDKMQAMKAKRGEHKKKAKK